VACPANSEGHPHCTCKAGYSGSILWDGSKFVGNCTENSQANVWEPVDVPDSSISCLLIRGPPTSAATSTGSTLEFSFGGSSTTISILRCDATLGDEFTKVQGSFLLTPTSNLSVVNNEEIVNYNSTQSTNSTGYVAFGTRHNIIDAGKEMGRQAAEYTTVKNFTIPETPVSQTNVLRFEIEQRGGVLLTISNINLLTYNIPKEVVKCVREMTTPQ